MSDTDAGGNANPDFTADFTTDLQVRFRDLDAMSHVNNAVYATYLEQARAEYYHHVIDEDLDDVDTVLVSLELEYRRPIELGDSVTVALETGELGRSSVPMDYEIYAGDRLAAVGHTVQVFLDDETGESKPIPDDWRGTMDG